MHVNVTMEEPRVHVVNDLGYMLTLRLPRSRIVGPEAEGNVVARETRIHGISYRRIPGINLFGTSAAGNGEGVLFEGLVSARGEKMRIR